MKIFYKYIYIPFAGIISKTKIPNLIILTIKKVTDLKYSEPYPIT